MWPQLKPADGAAFQKLHNFLIKCESATYGETWNALDTPEMMRLVLSKLPRHTRERSCRVHREELLKKVVLNGGIWCATGSGFFKFLTTLKLLKLLKLPSHKNTIF